MNKQALNELRYGSSSGSSSKRQKVTVPTVPVPVPQHWLWLRLFELRVGLRLTELRVTLLSYATAYWVMPQHK